MRIKPSLHRESGTPDSGRLDISPQPPLVLPPVLAVPPQLPPKEVVDRQITDLIDGAAIGSLRELHPRFHILPVHSGSQPLLHH